MEAIAGSRHKIVLVVTQPDRASGRCLKNTCPEVKKSAFNVKSPVFQPEDINSAESVEELKKYGAGIFVVVSYGQIMKKKVSSLPAYGAVNLHFSLLPKYRGSAPVNYALINGEKQTGVTIFKLDKGVDTGPMLSRVAVDISPEDDARTLFDKLCSTGAELLVKTLDDIEAGRAHLEEQDHSQATHTRMLVKQDGLVDWTLTSENVRNRIRGLLPWPKAFSFLHIEGKRKSLRVSLISSRIGYYQHHPDAKAGQVIAADNGGIEVQCGYGSVIITELQPENRAVMGAGAFINGHNVKKGGFFGKER